MARHRARLVAVLLALSAAALLTSACAPPLPREFYVESRWSPEERQMILDSAEKWNAVGREYLGIDRILVYRGVYDDPDGFHPDDLGGSESVVYRGEKDADYDFIDEGEEGASVIGYGTWGHVILYRFAMCGDDGVLNEGLFRQTATHEFGHFLGLGHVPDDTKALMFWLAGDNSDTITRHDIQAFCLVHDCLKQP